MDVSAEMSIPKIDLSLLANVTDNLLNQLNPLAGSQYCGLDIYMQVVSFLQTMLQG